MPRLLAKRLAVPAGRMASGGGSCVGSASSDRCTMPSPPQTSRSDAALVDGAANPLRRLAALLDLVPEQVLVPLGDEPLAQLGQAAAERLAGVGDDGDALHGWTPSIDPLAGSSRDAFGRCARRRSPTAITTRTAKAEAASAPTPSRAPATTSVRWCMPRYVRANATVRLTSDGDDPGDDPHHPVADGAVHDQRRAAPERERGRDVARGEAARRRGRVQAGDVRAGPVDDRVGHQEDRELEAQCADEEERLAPAVQEHAARRRRARAARPRATCWP